MRTFCYLEVALLKKFLQAVATTSKMTALGPNGTCEIKKRGEFLTRESVGMVEHFFICKNNETADL